MKNLRYQEIYRLAGAAINNSEDLQGEVAGTLILNDLIQNAGGITEPAPDMTSDKEMASWLRRHKQPVVTMAMKRSGLDDDVSNVAPTLLELIEKNLRKEMSMEGLLKNHARMLEGEKLEAKREGQERRIQLGLGRNAM